MSKDKEEMRDESQETRDESQETRVESEETQEVEAQENVEAQETEVSSEVEEPKDPTAEEQLAALRARVEELEDKNLRMMAEFDNYRRRTNKEKLELMETAGERIFTEMLPLVDDFERAINLTPTLSQGEGGEVQYKALKEGLELIYQKFLSFLDKHEVHVIETEGADFNTDEHEAVTTFAAGEDKKGKVIDCTQKGYKLGDKVIRFAKVVVGE